MEITGKNIFRKKNIPYVLSITVPRFYINRWNWEWIHTCIIYIAYIIYIYDESRRNLSRGTKETSEEERREREKEYGGICSMCSIYLYKMPLHKTALGTKNIHNESLGGEMKWVRGEIMHFIKAFWKRGKNYWNILSGSGTSAIDGNSIHVKY